MKEKLRTAVINYMAEKDILARGDMFVEILEPMLKEIIQRTLSLPKFKGIENHVNVNALTDEALHAFETRLEKQYDKKWNCLDVHGNEVNFVSYFSVISKCFILNRTWRITKQRDKLKTKTVNVL